MIAELRQQLYDLKSQDRDYRGVNDEIINMENRYKILSDDKVSLQAIDSLRCDLISSKEQESTGTWMRSLI